MKIEKYTIGGLWQKKQISNAPTPYIWKFSNFDKIIQKKERNFQFETSDTRLLIQTMKTSTSYSSTIIQHLLNHFTRINWIESGILTGTFGWSTFTPSNWIQNEESYCVFFAKLKFGAFSAFSCCLKHTESSFASSKTYNCCDPE